MGRRLTVDWHPDRWFDGSVLRTVVALFTGLVAYLTPSAALALNFGLPANVNSRVRLEVGGPKLGVQLLALAKTNHADIFVVGTHPHRGPCGQQWSVSHEVLALAPMSVVCVPDQEARSNPSAGEHRFRVAS